MNARDASTQALREILAHIRTESARECADIGAQAERAARTIVRDARRLARLRVHAALAAERAEIDAAHRRERAMADTRLRMHRQALTRSALGACWGLLRGELARRWRDPAARHAWAVGALRLARSRLIAKSWRIRHPADWPEAERSALAAEADTPAGDVGITWSADRSIDAGLLIECDGATLDATPGGLLARREQVEGRLLAVIERTASSGPARP